MSYFESNKERRSQLTIIEAIRVHRKRLVSLLFIVIFIAYVSGLSRPSAARQLTKTLPLTPIQNWIPNAQYFLGLRHRPDIIVHPIPKLMTDAQAKYKRFLSRQSKTVLQASREYRRRYKRDPPKGFDDWFAFAQQNGAKVIDDYDQLMSDLDPFWQFSGMELRRRAVQASFLSFASMGHFEWAKYGHPLVFQVGHLPSIDLVRLTNGKAITLNIEKGFEDTEVSARAKGFRVMIEKFQHKVGAKTYSSEMSSIDTMNALSSLTWTFL